MDPFSVVVGTVGLLDVCFRAGQRLTSLKNSIADVDKDLTVVQKDMDSILSTHGSLKSIWLSHHNTLPAGLRSDPTHAANLWGAVRQNLSDAKTIIEKLDSLLQKITGDKKIKDENTSTYVEGILPKKEMPSRFDGIKKSIKLQLKEGDLYRLQKNLGNCQANLQTLLIALNLWYTNSTYDSTDLSLSHLSDKMDEVQQLQFSLKYHLAILTPRLKASDSENLRSTISSATAVASSIRFNKHFYIPQNVSSIFTGRESLLEELKTTFQTSSPLQRNHIQRRFVIYGLGGSGKTQFCCKFAQDNRENFWGIFWIDGSSQESARHSFSDIANVGRVEPNERAAKSWLSSLERPWLLIIDNADDPSVSIEEFIPAGERGFILITTRNPSNRSYGTLGSCFYAFEKLEADEASDLLLKAAAQPSPWSLPIRNAAARIARTLGFLPLALLHAGKAILNGLCSLDNYLEYYFRTWSKIRRDSQRTKSRRSSMADEIKNLNLSIYSTYEVIYTGLEHSRDREDSRDAAELLKMFSFFYRENIEFNMLVAAATNPRLEQNQQKFTTQSLSAPNKRATWKETLWQWAIASAEPILNGRDRPALPTALQDLDAANPFDEDRLRNALALLAQLGLTMHNQSSDSYSIHPLVHIWARERPRTRTAEQAVWCEAAANVLARCILLQPPSDRLDSDERLRRSVLPHIEHVRDCQKRIRNQLAKNLEARTTRNWSRFLPLQIAPIAFGRREAREYTKFSLVYSKNGDFKTASILQEAVREFLCVKLGTDHHLTIGITRLLVGTYIELFRNTKALELQTRTLQACLTSLGADHPMTLKVKDTLGAILLSRGQFNDARKTFEEVVSDMTRVLGPDHGDTLIATRHIGQALTRFFLYREALELHLDVLTRMISTFGATHPETLNAKESVAVAYLDLDVGGQENLGTALELIEQVVYERNRKLGKEQPYTLLAILFQARIKDAMGQSEDAEKLIRSIVTIAERNLGMNHGGTLLGKAYLSQTLVHQRKYTDAEDILLDVVQRHKYEASVREDGEHPDRINYLWMLLNCYDLQGKIDDAIRIGEELHEALATIGGESLGPKHPFAKNLIAKQEELRHKKETMAGI